MNCSITYAIIKNLTQKKSEILDELIF